MVTCDGTIIVARITANQTSLCQKLYFANTNPAMVLVNITMVVMLPVTSKLFRNHLKKGEPVNTFLYPSSVQALGQREDECIR